MQDLLAHDLRRPGRAPVGRSDSRPGTAARLRAVTRAARVRVPRRRPPSRPRSGRWPRIVPLPQLVDDGQQLFFATRSILFRTSTTGTFKSVSSSGHELVAVPSLCGRVDAPASRTSTSAERFHRGVDHAHVHPVQRPVDARRIDEHDLPARGTLWTLRRRRLLGIVLRPRMRVRVVWGLSETIATFSPTMRLRRVDLPALGRP